MNDKLLAKHFACPQGLIGKAAGNLMNEVNAYINKYTLDFMEVVDNDRILEIGFGNGNFIQHILAKGNNIKYFGIEKSKIMIEEGIKKNCDNIQKGVIDLKIANNEHLSFESNSFTKVLAINLIYFINDINILCSEIHRVLKADGSLFLAFRAKKTMGSNKISEQYFNLFSIGEIKKILSNIGFVGFQYKEVSEVNNRDFIVVKAKKA